MSDYFKLRKKYDGKEKINIIFENEHLKNVFITFPKTTLSEFIDEINFRYGTNHKDFRFFLQEAGEDELPIQIIEIIII